MTSTPTAPRPAALSPAPATARPLAPEDVQRGQYVTVAQSEISIVPGSATSDTPPAGVRAVRVVYTPSDAGRPLRVRRVCLPFVMSKNAHGRVEWLDLRRQQLFLLNKDYGRSAFKALRQQPDAD